MKKPLALRPRGRLRLKYSTASFDAHRARPVARLPQRPVRCPPPCPLPSPSRAQSGKRNSGHPQQADSAPLLSVFALPAFTMTSMYQAAKNQAPATRQASDFMNLRLLRTSVAVVFGAALLVGPSFARGQATEPESPYGGTTVEGIIARVNDQIITKSDYDRAESELDQEGQQHGLSMQEMAAQRRDLFRNLIDQQLWLSKGKELDITGETELVKRLDEIRKQYNLDSLEDLEKAAKEQGVSLQDFKANIRHP